MTYVITGPGQECPRCGFESERDGWRDRHPAAAVCAGVFVGLPALYTVAGVTLAYPWFFVPVLVVVCAFVIDRRMRRRAAIAARADHDYRQQMLGAVLADPRLSPIAPPPASTPATSVRPTDVVARNHVMNRWPTTPLETDRLCTNRDRARNQQR